MNHSLSPTNRNSIFGWVKNLKKSNWMSNDSLNDVSSDNEQRSTNSRSPVKAVSSSQAWGLNDQQLDILQLPQNSHNFQNLHPPQLEFLKPLYKLKSRSSNNVSRVRSNSFNQSDKSSSLRQHRDSFLQTNALVDENSKYFGVSLDDAIEQASAKISILVDEETNEVLQYGKIPIVVAKCGIYIKKTGLTVEGIFRVGGSSKRLKELQSIFNTPPEFGKKLSWDGYTVHDAASILRRYLNALPEPLIPLNLYEVFREPLRSRQRIIHFLKYKAENPTKKFSASNSNEKESEGEQAGDAPATPLELLDSADPEPLTEANIYRFNNSTHLKLNLHTPNKLDNPEFVLSRSRSHSDLSQPENKTKSDENKTKTKKSKNYVKLTRDIHEAINDYQTLVQELPELSKQLLFYILDLLAMVQNHSLENLMSSRNLAAIFQPSILSHPNHDMDPIEYALSQSVVEFLIQYAYKLLPDHNSASAELKEPDALPQAISPVAINEPKEETVDLKDSEVSPVNTNGVQLQIIQNGKTKEKV